MTKRIRDSKFRTGPTKGWPHDLTELKRVWARHERLVEISNVGIWAADESGLNTYSSVRWCEITGMAAEQALGLGWTHGVHPDDRGMVVEAVKQACVHYEPFEAEFRFVHSGGRVVWVRCQASFLNGPEGLPGEWIGTLHDITPHKMAERSLHASEVKYRTLFDLLPVGVNVIDGMGHIVECNRASESLLGMTREEQERWRNNGRGKNAVRPDGTPMPPEEFASCRALKESRLIRGVEMGIVKSPEHVTWINVAASPIALEGMGVAVAFDDITERKAAERELDLQRTKLRTLAEELTCSEEKQRRHVALRLHDGVGQMLSVAMMKIREAETLASDGNAERLAAIRRIVEQALADTRTLTGELASPLLYDAGLVPALGWLAERFSEQHPDVRFHVEGEADPGEMPCRVLLYQIAKELMFNVVKHARARNAWITLEDRGGRMQMRIRDDGIGGVMAGTVDSLRREDGFGLFSIRERIRLHGGDMVIDSPAGGGTAVTVLCGRAAMENGK